MPSTATKPNYLLDGNVLIALRRRVGPIPGPGRRGPGGRNQVLCALRDSPTGRFGPDAISYASVPLDPVSGDRQITDAYLAALAPDNEVCLATLDQALPGAVLLIP